MADKETPKSSVPSTEAKKPQEAGKTIEGIIKDAAKESRRKPEEVLAELHKILDQKKLDIRLDTQSGASEVKVETEKALAKGGNEGMPYLGQAIDSIACRRQAEQEMNKLPGLKDVLSGVEKVEDLRALKVSELIKLEDTYEGILLYAFTDVVGDKQKLDFKNWSTVYTEPKPGTKFQVNFRGNNDGERLVGAADLLPPSIRAMTLYENADPNKARTSERRIGLKGQNKPGTGFFDKNGYMAVHTGDMIEISGIDNTFDQQFRKKPDGSIGKLDEDAYKRYGESEEGKKDKEYLADLYKRNPNAQRNKQMTPEEIDGLIENIDASGSAKKVIEMALNEVREKLNSPKDESRNCGQIIGGIYRRAGVSERQIYRDTNYEGLDCGDHHADQEMTCKIRPGDWLWYNNYRSDGNEGWKGLHSALVVSYNADTGEAELASGNVGKGIRLHKKNLKESLITRIVKPGDSSSEPEKADYAEVHIDESRSVIDQIRGLDDGQRNMAAMIEEEFLAAGLPRSVAAAAIVNAKAESQLRPWASGDSGHSIGLFQLHDKGGGHGMSVEERSDARTNIQTILKREVLGKMGATLRARAESGASVSELAAIFSRDIERPRDKRGEMDKRAKMTARLFRNGSDSQSV